MAGRRWILVAAWAVGLVGCTSTPIGSEPTMRPSSSAGSAELSNTGRASASTVAIPDCAGIGDSAPDATYLVLAGVVALPQPTLPALQTARQPEPATPQEAYFAKQGLGFTIGTAWTLTVASESRDHLRIGWGSAVRSPALTVRPPHCDWKGRTGWVWYPGGYWVDHPGCYAVVVEAKGHTVRVPIGLGAPCPGQALPEGPSDP